MASFKVREPESTPYHIGAEHLHAVHIGGLALDILDAHVDMALQAQTGSNGGRSHAMLTGAGFRNDARLAHGSGQQGLANGVVYLVSAGMVEVFALQIIPLLHQASLVRRSAK